MNKSRYEGGNENDFEMIAYIVEGIGERMALNWICGCEFEWIDQCLRGGL